MAKNKKRDGKQETVTVNVKTEFQTFSSIYLYNEISQLSDIFKNTICRVVKNRALN